MIVAQRGIIDTQSAAIGVKGIVKIALSSLILPRLLRYKATWGWPGPFDRTAQVAFVMEDVGEVVKSEWRLPGEQARRPVLRW
jgi:hypothetical protein